MKVLLIIKIASVLLSVYITFIGTIVLFSQEIAMTVFLAYAGVLLPVWFGLTFVALTAKRIKDITNRFINYFPGKKKDGVNE